MDHSERGDRSFDQIVAQAVRRLLAATQYHNPATDTPAGESFFPAEQGAIYRIPLESETEVSVSAAGDTETRTVRGEGLRLFVADPKPLGLFAKPVAAVVLSRRQAQAAIEAPSAPLDSQLIFISWWQLEINGARLPMLNAATLAEWQVDGLPIPVPPPQPPEPPEPGPVIFADEVSGPFPRDNPPNPGSDSGPPVPSTSPADPAHPDPLTPGTDPTDLARTCSPTALYYGLICDPEMKDAAQKVRDAFIARGYKGQNLDAGQTSGGVTMNTFQNMMAALAQDLATHIPPYCSCPSDQLVILVNAHGSGGVYGGFNFHPDQPGMDDGHIFYDDLFKALAAIPAITAHPEKVVLIISSCHSGCVLTGCDGTRGSLKGMQVITSSDDSRDITYQSFDYELAEAVKPPHGATWADLVAWLKYRIAEDNKTNSSVHRPHCATGIVGGCEMRIQFVSATYSGTDIGKVGVYLRANHLEWQPASGDPLWIEPGQSAEYKPAFITRNLFGKCAPTNCGGKVAITLEATGGSNKGYNPGQMGQQSKNIQTLEFVCNGTTYTDSRFKVDVQDEVGNTATMTFNLNVETKC
jgi:hypothetical protein